MTKADKEGQRKAPILRFKGFTDDWEQRKLKQLGNIKRGASPRPISDPKWFDKNGKYGWLRISDVTSQNGQVFQIDQHLSSIGEEKTVLISDPHLIISIAATVGKPCINYIPTAIHDGFVTFLDYKFNLDFMFEWFNKNQNIWLKYGQPGAQINLNSSIIGNQEIKLPKAYEQEKIAKLFNILNNLLALYERKLQLNLKLYAELLNQFIPDKNSKSILNKINWQSISLGKIAHLQKGKQKNRNDISEVRNDKETYPVYNGGKEKSGYTDEYNRNDSIIISEGGNSAGYVNYIAGKFYSGGHNYSIEPQNIDSSLLYLILLRNQSRIMNLRTGSGLPNIKISSLKSFKIFIPSKNDNLYDFDKLLILLTKDNNLIKDKLNKLKLIKKTLLNTMFI